MIYVTNPNFNTLPAVKQPWLIKYQMLRYIMAYPNFIFGYLGLSMWFSNQINWIISEVQRQKKNLMIFLTSDKVLAMLGSWIGTCLVLSSFTFKFRTMCPRIWKAKYGWSIGFLKVFFELSMKKFWIFFFFPNSSMINEKEALLLTNLTILS